MIIGCAEKLVPVVPSAGVYLFVGMRFAHGPLDIAALTAATVIGSTAGSICWYAAGRLLNRARTAPAAHVVRLKDRKDRWHSMVCRMDCMGIAGLQLLPVVRVYSAFIFGSLSVRFRRFVTGTLFGCTGWNGALISAGAVVSRTASNGRPSEWAVVMVIVAGQCCLFGATWVVRRCLCHYGAANPDISAH
ncbi:DedA family protein [Rhizobium sp. Root1203]|uniref:DedA family protein n=1 Tax=Rhizobium sp. Root1203 TaxID=1736427 RepID=UPI003FD22085